MSDDHYTPSQEQALARMVNRLALEADAVDLSNRDRDRFLASLDGDAEPNSALRKAARLAIRADIASAEVNYVIRDIIEILDDPEANEGSRRMAVATLTECMRIVDEYREKRAVRDALADVEKNGPTAWEDLKKELDL